MVMIPMVFCASLLPWLKAIYAAETICSLLNVFVTSVGEDLLNSHVRNDMRRRLRIKPIRGEKTNPMKTLYTPV